MRIRICYHSNHCGRVPLSIFLRRTGFVPRLRFQSGACFSTTSAVAAKEFAETQTRLKAQGALASARGAASSIAPATAPATARPSVATVAPPGIKPRGTFPRPQSANPAVAPRIFSFENEEKPWLQDKAAVIPGALSARSPQSEEPHTHSQAHIFALTTCFVHMLPTGYSGFVPHSALKNGKSFTVLTRRALEEFKDPSSEARHELEAAAESFKARLANVSVEIYHGAQSVRTLVPVAMGGQAWGFFCHSLLLFVRPSVLPSVRPSIRPSSLPSSLPHSLSN